MKVGDLVKYKVDPEGGVFIISSVKGDWCQLLEEDKDDWCQLLEEDIDTYTTLAALELVSES